MREISRYRLVGFCLIMGCICITNMVRADVVVSNLTFVQRPGTKLVDITYDVSCTNATQVKVSLSVTNGSTAVNATNVTGDIGFGVSTGTGKTMVWDMSTDWTNASDQVTVTVTGEEDLTYLVIDLSGGTNAVSYPVTSLASLPDPIPDGYKTTNLVLRLVSAGVFIMGSPTNELGRDDDEEQHQVTLTKDFHMGVFEVTQKQWELVMGTNPSYYATGDMHPVDQVNYDDIRGTVLGTNWPAANTVDASSFLGRLRSKTGLTLDLPTEAQWEYACRATTTLAYNDYTKNGGAGSDCLLAGFGEDTNLNPLAWYSGNALSLHHQDVGLKQRNYWGLYDMHGNILEACLDWYLHKADNSAPVTDPKGGTLGSERVYRGGCWAHQAYHCRSARRNSITPSNGGYVMGLRLCLTPED